MLPEENFISSILTQAIEDLHASMNEEETNDLQAINKVLSDNEESRIKNQSVPSKFLVDGMLVPRIPVPKQGEFERRRLS